VEYWYEGGASRAISGLFGALSFRVRARDRAGNLQDWSTANVVTTTVEPPVRMFLPIVNR
jgi:hypothetical protein